VIESPKIDHAITSLYREASLFLPRRGRPEYRDQIAQMVTGPIQRGYKLDRLERQVQIAQIDQSDSVIVMFLG